MLLKSNLLHILWAIVLLAVVSAGHINYVLKETRPSVEDELEYGYLSIPLYHLFLNKDQIPQEKTQYLQAIYNNNKTDLTLLHKYLAINYYLFGKNIKTFRLSLLPLFILILLSIFLLTNILIKNKTYSLTLISLLISSPAMITYSRTLWTPLYSSAFIFLGLYFSLKSKNFSSLKYTALCGISLGTASTTHYSGLLFSGIIIIFILIENFSTLIQKKKSITLFSLLYIAPQISTLPLMLFNKTRGCISGINPPDHFLKYAVMQIPNLFWFKILFYILFVFFIFSSTKTIISQRKNTDNIIFLFYLLMVPSLWLIKINTGLQTHFVTLSLSMIITFYALSQTKYFPTVCKFLLIVSVIGISLNFLHPTPYEFKNDFFTQAIRPERKDFGTQNTIALIKENCPSIKTITVLNPDEFFIGTKHPLDNMFLELSLHKQDHIVFKILNNKAEIKKWIDDKNKKQELFILEESKKYKSETVIKLKKHLEMILEDKNIITTETKDRTIHIYRFNH